MGYKSYYKIINAKDFNIPQNRQRLFVVSIREFTFPNEKPLNRKLIDMLENNVNQKYVLSQNMVNCFMSEGTGKYPRRERFLQNMNRKDKDIAVCITTKPGTRPTDNYIPIKNATKLGYLKAYPGDGVNLNSRMKYQRGNVQPQSIQTITTLGGNDRGGGN